MKELVDYFCNKKGVEKDPFILLGQVVCKHQQNFSLTYSITKFYLKMKLWIDFYFYEAL